MTFIRVQPSAACTTTEYPGYVAVNAINDGATVEFYSQIAPNQANQKFVAEFAIPWKVRRIVLVNANLYDVLRGVKNFSIYGSNDVAAKNNVATYSDNTGLILLASGLVANTYNAATNPFQIFTFANDTAYLYYVLKIADNYGGNVIGIKNISFFVEVVGEQPGLVFSPFITGSQPVRTDRNRIAGQVIVDNLPAKRMIVVLDRATFTVLASTWSDATTGHWEIKCLPEFNLRSLLVLSMDTTGELNSELADYVSQVTL